MSDLAKDLIEVLKQHKAIDDRSIRNFQIRQRYRELRSILHTKGKRKGKPIYSCAKARKIISEEFYLSESRIKQIIYE